MVPSKLNVIAAFERSFFEISQLKSYLHMENSGEHRRGFLGVQPPPEFCKK